MVLLARRKAVRMDVVAMESAIQHWDNASAKKIITEEIVLASTIALTEGTVRREYVIAPKIIEESRVRWPNVLKAAVVMDSANKDQFVNATLGGLAIIALSKPV